MVTREIETMIRASTVLLCLLIWPFSGTRAAEQERVIWQIGAFDRSSREFRSQGIDYSDPKSNPVYRPGKSREAEDWLRFQPGPANGMAGGRVHPFTVLFDLSETPAGVYRLTVAILYETPRLSHLRVDINGRAGDFYFHPKLEYGAGDWEGTFVPQTSADTKVIELPAAWLRQGENRLTLTALDSPDAAENSLGSIALGHTGIVYDALKLTQAPREEYSARRVHATVSPTIFFRSTQEGLTEIVEALADFAKLPKTGELTLRVPGKRLTESFTASGDFGEVRFEFAVPEWQGHLSATLGIEANGRKEAFTFQLAAQKKWTIYIVPHEHLDVGFTDYPEKVAELHAETVDGVMDLFATHPDFRWTLDGSWVAEKYLAGRSPEKQAQFLQAIRDKTIILPMQFANQHTGVASLEGLIRSLYSSASLARRYSLPIGAAHITDVPSYSWSYASVLHDAGVKYFAAASNSWRAPVLLLGRWNEKSPFYWEGPDGGRVLMWYSRAYLQLATLFGTPPRLDAIQDALPVYLQAYSRADYRASATIIFGSQLENTALSKEQADLPRQWQTRYAWPRLEFSSFADAMAEIERPFAGHIPVFRGDFGPYWEDGFGSDSLHTALDRQNQQRILSAEKLGSIPGVLDRSLRPDQHLLSSAWRNILLFDEHTWTYVGATTEPDSRQTVTQLALKRGETTAASEAIERSLDRSWAQLESFLGPKENSLVVFNSLSWSRSGFVEMDLPDGQGLFDTTTHQQIATETLAIGRTTPLPGFGGGYRKVRFLAEDIPPMGYKLFALRSLKEQPELEEERLDATSFESPFYRVTLDPASGGVESIWDKQLNRELVDRGSLYRFGAYVYVQGADDMPNNSLYRYGATLDPPELTPVAASNGRLVSAHRSNFGIVIVLVSSAPHTPLVRTEITLLEKEKRIAFCYTIQKESVLSKEAAYIAFPFAIKNPEFAYETQNGWVNPARDELAGGSREWYAVNHWAAVSGDGATAAVIPRDAPLVNFGDIVRGNWPSEFRPKGSAIFSWIMNNYWGTNFAPEQGGEFTFRYDVVTDSSLDPAKLTRMGWGTMTPLESDSIGAAFTPGVLPPTESELMQVDNPNVAVVTWKLAENGDGSIVRLEEIAGLAERVNLTGKFWKIVRAWQCTALEENQSSLPVKDSGVELSLGPFEILTIRLHTAGALSSVPAETTGTRSDR
jgi:hypothetical protein